VRSAAAQPGPPRGIDAIIWLATAALLMGCDAATAIRPDDIRSYSAPKPTAMPRVASAEPFGASVPAATSGVRYEVPEGWTDRGGSGIRLATLLIGEPSAGQEVTVIPASGTLRDNVVRWQKQLTAEADPAAVEKAVEKALAAADTVDVDGAKATVVMLTDDLAGAAPEPPDASPAILGAMIPREDASAVFVKYRGTAGVARQEKARFLEFVASFRWK
jgi:hypothetical protein